MENIEINPKLVIIVVLISAILGTLLWAGYNMYTKTTEEENQGIENFESDVISNISNTNSNNNTNNNTEFNISEIIGDDGFEINNSNATAPKQDWVNRICIFRESGYTTMHFVPNDWNVNGWENEKNGVKIRAKNLKIKGLSKDTSYEDLLNMFIEEKQKNTSFPNKLENFSKRSIYINGEKFYVIVEKALNNKWVNEYFCLAKDEYVYYLELGSSKDNYNQETIKLLDEIYSTFRIVK